MLDKPETWIQGAFSGYREDDGNFVTGPDAEYEDCWCLTGALLSAIGKHHHGVNIHRDIIASVWQIIYNPGMLPGNMTLVQWNDEPDRTHADVLLLLDHAIEHAQAAQNID